MLISLATIFPDQKFDVSPGDPGAAYGGMMGSQMGNGSSYGGNGMGGDSRSL